MVYNIAKNLYILFNGALYFSKGFITNSSWSFIDNGKKIEIDLLMKIGMNAYNFEKCLEIYDDFFYSIGGQYNNLHSKITKDKTIMKKDSLMKSNFIIYEITENPELMADKLQKLENNIVLLQQTNIIADLNDIFIAGVATKRKINSKILENHISILPNLMKLNIEGRLFFVFHPEETLEKIPEMIINIDNIINQISELKSMMEKMKILLENRNIDKDKNNEIIS